MQRLEGYQFDDACRGRTEGTTDWPQTESGSPGKVRTLLSAGRWKRYGNHGAVVVIGGG